MTVQRGSDLPSGITLHDSTSLSDQIYQSLRHALMHQEFSPGTRMVETALSARLGVSRTPVREALNRLTVEGWLESRPNKGVIVAGLNPQKIRERYNLREVLEGYGAREAADRITYGELDQLDRICDRAEEALTHNHAATFAQLDGELHEGILRASGNESLLAIWRQHLHPVRHAVFVLGLREHRHNLIQQHRRILAAMRGRDGELVEGAMRDHLQYAMHVYLDDTGDPLD